MVCHSEDKRGKKTRERMVGLCLSEDRGQGLREKGWSLAQGVEDGHWERRAFTHIGNEGKEMACVTKRVMIFFFRKQRILASFGVPSVD